MAQGKREPKLPLRSKTEHMADVRIDLNNAEITKPALRKVKRGLFAARARRQHREKMQVFAPQYFEPKCRPLKRASASYTLDCVS